MLARANVNEMNDLLKNWVPPERDQCFICVYPLPLRDSHNFFRPCCGKIVCCGCLYAEAETYAKHGTDQAKVLKCQFCRTTYVDDDRYHVNQYTRLAEVGRNHEAMYLLGQRYFSGSGVDQDVVKAVEWYRRAISAGNAKAATMLGLHYTRGVGLEQDIETGVSWLHIAALRGDPMAYLILGRVLWDANKYREAVPYLRKAYMCGMTKDDDDLFPEPSDVMRYLLDCYRAGFMAKSELEATLRVYQKSVGELETSSRKEYKSFMSTRI